MTAEGKGNWGEGSFETEKGDGESERVRGGWGSPGGEMLEIETGKQKCEAGQLDLIISRIGDS